MRLCKQFWTSDFFLEIRSHLPCVLQGDTWLKLRGSLVNSKAFSTEASPYCFLLSRVVTLFMSLLHPPFCS